MDIKTRRDRIEYLKNMHLDGELTDVSDIANMCWEGHTVLIQTELFELINRPGVWISCGTDRGSVNFAIEDLLICIWQWLRDDDEWLLGGKATHIPICLSTLQDLLIVTELLQRTDGTVSRVILITLAGDEETAKFYSF